MSETKITIASQMYDFKLGILWQGLRSLIQQRISTNIFFRHTGSMFENIKLRKNNQANEPNVRN